MPTGKYLYSTEVLTGKKLKVIVEKRHHFWRDGTEILAYGQPLARNTAGATKLQSGRRQKQRKTEPAPLQTGGRLNSKVIHYPRSS